MNDQVDVFAFGLGFNDDSEAFRALSCVFFSRSHMKDFLSPTFTFYDRNFTHIRPHIFIPRVHDKVAAGSESERVEGNANQNQMSYSHMILLSALPSPNANYPILISNPRKCHQHRTTSPFAGDPELDREAVNLSPEAFRTAAPRLPRAL